MNRLRTIINGFSKKRFSYDPLIKVNISVSALIQNFSEFRKLLSNSKTISPVLKSNAYGHGLITVAEIIEKNIPPNEAPFFIVDSYFEALTIRRAGISRPILIIGYTPTHTVVINKLSNISFVVTSIFELNEIAKKKKAIKIHIKIDTGMNRQGIQTNEIDEAMKIISSSKIILEGVCSHFSDASNLDSSFTLEQIKVWNNCVRNIRNKFPFIKYFHTSATAGHIHEGVTIDSNLTRLGIGLYGIHEGSSVNSKVSLIPALSMETVLSDVKKVKKGSSIGYGRTFVAPDDMTIATLPAGYFEGIDRRLSNKGYFTFPNGKITPIVGRVSMNITTIDISDVPSTKIGEKIVLISNNPKSPNSIENIARDCQTIVHEILIHIPAHLKRTVIK